MCGSIEIVTERYLGWLDDQMARKFIVTAATISKVTDLKIYIRERAGTNSFAVAACGLCRNDAGQAAND